MSHTPECIVCLSAESADWLWRIGAWNCVVGVTADPDLVITFSDVQASLAAELIKRGLPMLSTNQRTLAEIEATLALLGRVVDREADAERLLSEFRDRPKPVQHDSQRPRVYFEEWNDPLIAGIAWFSELIERAGGEDIFSELRTKRAVPERVVSSVQICSANPEIIFASWCGKPARPPEISARTGWAELAAVRRGRVHEIADEDILQPGFRLVYGYERLKKLILAQSTVRES
jgi:iron complex transport system substrate-binding protein